MCLHRLMLLKKVRPVAVAGLLQVQQTAQVHVQYISMDVDANINIITDSLSAGPCCICDIHVHVCFQLGLCPGSVLEISNRRPQLPYARAFTPSQSTSNGFRTVTHAIGFADLSLGPTKH
jgi:hypothetical protein